MVLWLVVVLVEEFTEGVVSLDSSEELLVMCGFLLCCLV